MWLRARWFVCQLKCRLLIFTLIPPTYIIFVKVFINQEIHDWKSDTSLDISVYLDQYQTLIRPENLHFKNEDFLAVIVSYAGNFENRMAIRQTWKNQLQKTKVIFQVGLHSTNLTVNENVVQEAKEHGDILLQNVIEHYTNLTLKTAMILKFCNDELTSTSKPLFLFKLDDDIFLNSRNINKLLRRISTHQNAISGFVYQNVVPIRWVYKYSSDNESYKWIVPKWMFSGHVFPDYVAGPGYFIPSKHIKCLLKQSLSTPQLYLEDVFFTGVLRQKCHFRLRHEASLLWVNPCTHLGNVTMIHHVTAQDQFKYQGFFNQTQMQKKANIFCSD